MKFFHPLFLNFKSLKRMTPAYQKAGALLRLMRVNRPIGTILILMPTLWSLWIASHGAPSLLLIFIFTAGSFLMRSAGCVINDIADRNFDPYVTRTKHRPIASREVSVKEGVILFIILVGLSFLIILPLNLLTILLSFAGLCLAILYPFTKRLIPVPQAVLGISFGWGAILAWSAVRDTIGLPAISIFIANVFWSLAYDTIYALMDRDEDLKIGIKSSAILFGSNTWIAVGLFHLMVLLFLIWTGYLAQLGRFFYFSLTLVGIAFIHQVFILRKGPSPQTALNLFKNHGSLGFLIFLGIASDYLTKRLY